MPGYDDAQGAGYPILIWSPDSRYIAYTTPEFPLRVIDLHTGMVAQLVENAIAYGWSDMFPVEWP
jgi:hypothetical protein